MTENNVLLLVDGSSYLYRAYHALPDLRNGGGFPTGAIYGVAAMLKRLLQDFPADIGACVFDAPGRTFRDEWYADYKATRTTMPSDLALQIEPIREIVRLLGWPVIELPGIEADDAIGTLAHIASRDGRKVVISTGDKDLAQLVTDRITWVNTMAKPYEVLDPAAVREKFGVAPEQIADWLSLVGDSVDNIPGVDKVGPKTAAKWIAEHGSLEGVIAAAPSMKGVAGDNLRRAAPWLPTAKKLVTVVCDCDLSAAVVSWPKLDALGFGAIDRDGLLAFYERYEFKAWRRELLESAPVEAPVVGPAAAEPEQPRAYETVLDDDALERWIAKLHAAPLVAIDTEIDTLDPMRARLIGLSFATSPVEACYIPLCHDHPGAPTQLTTAHALQHLQPWLEDASRPKLGQHVKLDVHVFANHGIALRGVVHDTMLQSYVLEAHKPHDLKNLAERHLGRSGVSYESLCGKGANQIPFAQVDVALAAEYACEDGALTLQLHRLFWPRIEAEPGLRRVYETIEMPISEVLGRIERNGVLIDAQLLAQQSRELAERMMALEREAYELAGQPFNLGSPKQIGEVLFGKLSLPVLKKTMSGAPSTDEEVLAELAKDYPLPARILDHRSLSKLKGTYTDKLPAMVNPDTGRVHTTYAQAVAVTGRLSSNEPNLQNIPIRTVEGRRIREAFIAPPGHAIVSADYSQIELRIMAHISGDPGLLRAFTEGIDVHRATAAEVFNAPLDGVSHEQRRFAKVINFGLIYGMSAFGLASNLGIEQKAARDYIDRYFARFAGVKRYMDATRASAAANGYVETLFGRRIVLPDIRAGGGPRRAAAERQAINAPMQGTAADLIKLAMIAIDAALDGRGTKMIMQVHDELVFEVPDGELDWVQRELPALMSGVAQLAVPLVAEVGVGPNWDKAH
jgi:DNA polymerase-1